MANLRSEYIKDLISEKNKIDDMLSEATKESLKGILSESVNEGIRNYLMEAQDEFEEEIVDDPKSQNKSKKNSTKKGADKKEDAKTKKAKSSKKDEKDEKELDIDDEEDDIPDVDEEDVDFEDGDFSEDADDTDVSDFEETEDDGGDGEDDDLWDDLEGLKDEDGEYDLTSLGTEEGVKILRVLDPDRDGVRIVKNNEGDSVYTLTDEDNDVEYVIQFDQDFGTGVADNESNYDDIEGKLSGISDEEDFDGFGGYGDESDDFGDESDTDEFEANDFEDEEYDVDDKKTKNMMESIGYTNKYQSKTAMTMPGDDGSGKTFNGGIPKGSKNNGKRYGNGIGSGDPFSEKSEYVFEVELNTETPLNSEEDEPQVEEALSVGAKRGTKTIGKTSPYRNKAKSNFNESVKREIGEVKKENKELYGIANQFKNKLQESVVINASLAKIIKLITENSTTKNEKLDIVNRFNQVKNLKECKALYETISRELSGKDGLNKAKKLTHKPILENAKKKKDILVETTLLQNDELQHSLNLMKRMGQLKK